MSSLLKRKHVLAAIGGARSYQATIVADGAVAYWPLDETSGTTAFDKIGTRHGTISGGVTLNQAGVNGSKCMTFDGSTGKISLPSITLPAISSVEAWYKSTYNSFHVIWTNRTSAISTNSYLQGSGGVAGRPQFKCGASVADSPASILTNDGQWHHVVGISTGSKTQVFVDGVVGADFTTPGTATTGVGYIGFDDFSSGPMTLQDIAIYNRALTPAEIQSHYTKRLEGAPFSGLVSTANMVSYWPLKTNGNDIHGTNHLTNTNGVVFTGQEADFESTLSQYLSHPDPTPLGDEDFTYALWFKPESLANNTILCKGGGRTYWFDFNSDANVVRFLANFGSQQASVFLPIVVGQWYFAVFGYNSATDKLFAQVNDGTMTEATAALASAGGAVTIGALDGGGSNFDGLIKMVGLWRRVLTAQERTNLWNSGNGLPY